jgi:hypothetical protein
MWYSLAGRSLLSYVRFGHGKALRIVTALVPALGKGFRSTPGRNLPESPDMRHNKAMEQLILIHFALALLSAGAPWLAAVVVVAIAVASVGPIHLNLSIGERSSQRKSEPHLARSTIWPQIKGLAANIAHHVSQEKDEDDERHD